MAQNLRSRCRTAGLAALAIGMVWASSANTQPPAGKDPLPVPEGGVTLYLVVRTKANVPDSRVVKTLTAGMESSLHTMDGTPIVKPVSPSFFEQFAELIGSSTPREALQDAQPGKLGIQPLPAREGVVYELKTPSVNQTITKLNVKYQPTSDSKKNEEEYVPKAPGEGPLSMIEPGRFSFRPLAGRTPIEYKAETEGRDESSKQLTQGEIKGDWPQGNKFSVVTMKNFRKIDGRRPEHEQFLREIERQNLNTANPIQITRLGGDQLFVFADMAGGGARVGSTVVGNSLELRVPGPVGRNTRRVWVLFPLNEDDYQKNLDRYTNLDPAAMPDEIRKNAATVSDQITVGPKSKPRWIELPPDLQYPGMFYRRVPLSDLSDLANEFPTVRQLTVWEFEHPTALAPNGSPQREAIQVKNDKDQDVSALGSQVPNWATELRRAAPPK